MRLLEIHGKTWAVGLHWHHGGTAKRRKFSEIVAEAEKFDPALNLVALNRLQHGFAECHKEDVADAAKSHALAASLKLTATSFLGVFRLRSRRGRDFWWVLALRDGLISGQGDNVFQEREEADAHVISLQDLLGSFEETVLCGTEEESVAWLAPLLKPWGLVSRISGSPRLRPLREAPRKRGKIFFVVCAVGVLVLAYVLVDFYLEHESNMRAEEALRIALQDKEARKREITAHPELHFDQGWLKAPLAVDAVRRCIQPMLTLPTVSGGWKMESAACDGKNVSVTWLHAVWGDYLVLPDKSRLESTSKSVSRYPFKAPLPARAKEKLLTQDMISRKFYQLTQNAGARLRLSFEAPEQKEVEGIQVTAPFRRGKWDLSDVPAACILDDQLLRELSLPGVTLESVNVNNNIWTFRGTVYGN